MSSALLPRDELIMHHDRVYFSARCHNNIHKSCSGITKRGDGSCKCPCHKIGDKK